MDEAVVFMLVSAVFIGVLVLGHACCGAVTEKAPPDCRSMGWTPPPPAWHKEAEKAGWKKPVEEK
jgi:hypothetical protein